MSGWLSGLIRALITLAMMVLTVACTPAKEANEQFGAGFIAVDAATWPTKYTTSYPFTVPNGEIVCGLHPSLGREVYFMPAGFTDESYIGTPLNQAAADSLKRDGMSSNVPYSIKKDANLSAAVQAGLKVCDEQLDGVGNS